MNIEEHAAKLEGLAEFYPAGNQIGDAARDLAAEIRKSKRHRRRSAGMHKRLSALSVSMDPHSTAAKMFKAAMPEES